MTNAVGPCFTGGFEEFVVNDESGEQYTILYLPDLNNDQLQKEGKPPVYYWVPGTVRLARKGDTGDYKFRHIHFVGVLDEDLHTGIEGRSEVQGGLLSFTTTSRYPTSVLKQAEEQLLKKFRGDDDRYWGWRTTVAPMFRIAPIKDNRTVITNLAPGRDGTAPAENINPPLPAPTPTPDNGNTPATPPGPRSLVRHADMEKRVVHGRSGNVSNLDAWAWNIQGQGPGSVTGGENAYSGLIGALPSELIWAGFQGGSSPITVAQNLMLPVWSEQLYLNITGKWDRIFQHFSGHANGRYKWFSADIKAEFNKLRINGGIKVEIHVDGTLPNAAEMEKIINQRMDLILQKFMEEASKRIFEPAEPDVKPAKAPSGGLFSGALGFGAGLALKYRRDEQHLELSYEETRHHRYLQPTTISSSFEGFFNEMKNDPEAEKKYFTRLILGDLGRKVTRVVKTVVNWSDPAKEWVGDPVAFLSAEVGYPGPTGVPQWASHVFQSTDTTEETTWKPAFAQRNLDEVANPPQGWQPDMTYIRRRVHLTEPLGASDNKFVNIAIEKNVIDLDPDGGTLASDSIIEVRADSVGKLEVGPMEIDVELENAKQIVTVEFKALGQTHDGYERPIVKFDWHHDDQTESRYWEIFTGQLDYTPRYEYRVSVTVKGTIFSKGMSWTGPWNEGIGNGPLMVHVPTPDEAGVSTRRISPRDLSLNKPVTNRPAEPEPVAAPPNTMPPTNGGNGLPGQPPVIGRTTDGTTSRTVAGYKLSDPSRSTSSKNPDKREFVAGSEPSDESPDPAKEPLALIDGWVKA